MKRLRRPVPIWVLVAGILVAAAVATAVFIGASYLGPKPDFSLNPVQVSNSLMSGHAISGEVLFRVRVTSVNGFSGVVSFNATALAGFSVRLNGIGSPNPVVILGRNDTIEAFVSASNVGNYTPTVTGIMGYCLTLLLLWS